MENKINNIIEVAWIVMEEYYSNDQIECIPMAELKELIVQIAEKFEDTYKGVDWGQLEYYEEITVFTNKEVAQNLWDRFGGVPMNPETEVIEESWNGFPAGTHREKIWHWFEKIFHVSVADDLM